jgi:mRNA interferase RelE/StbE
MKFQIDFKQSVKKDLRKIESHFVEKIFVKIRELENFPDVAGLEKLSGFKDYFRMRIGDYRAVFRVFGKKYRIEICYIRHRKFVYKSLS